MSELYETLGVGRDASFDEIKKLIENLRVATTQM